MKSILKKLNIGGNSSSPNHSDDSDGPSPPSFSRGAVDGRGRSKSPSIRKRSHSHHHEVEPKPLSGLSEWFNSVARRNSNSDSPPLSTSTSPSGSISQKGDQKIGTRDSSSYPAVEATASAAETVRRDSDLSSRPNEDPAEMDEEYQIQLALELSAREDPEAVQIEAVKQISLGSCAPQNTPAEVIAYRYWNYNALGYEDKILDGFYDLYGIIAEPALVKMPSLVDLQGAPLTCNITWEAVLVDRADDPDLVKLEQEALVRALESRSGFLGFAGSDVVNRLALLVANYMGGAVSDPESMLKSWTRLSNYLRETIGNMVLPLGRLTVGLARHRALLFKVLADSVGVPCRLLKGKQYTGTEDGALNIVKFQDGRECIVDLMADPGALIPYDAMSPNDFEDNFLMTNSFTEEVDNLRGVSTRSYLSSSLNSSENDIFEKRSVRGSFSNADTGGVSSSDLRNHESQSASFSRPESSAEDGKLCVDGRAQTQKVSSRSSPPVTLAQSCSEKGGIHFPVVRDSKVKDVSQYMLNAAKGNPQLVQRLYDVLLESGIEAPPDLFSETYTDNLVSENMNLPKNGLHDMRSAIMYDSQAGVESEHVLLGGGADQHMHQSVVRSRLQLDPVNRVDALGLNHSRRSQDTADSSSSQPEVPGVQLQDSSMQLIRHMPVAAAAATAAVVASSMFVAAAKSNSEISMEVPVAAAAAVVATTAAVSRQYEQQESGDHLPNISSSPNKLHITNKDGEDHMLGNYHREAFRPEMRNSNEGQGETERTSDKSSGNESVKSDVTLDDVAEVEIPWEDITLGERIGLGSFGEVYRGDWHGTEVAVKRFLHQDISGDALEEFITEVRIMKRLRHPNVVLFMGAVTRIPNLSIVTEFLPRGSLFRLIHRPNNQLDERRRLRMAFDIARGMNYLHNCNPVIVHRDLKSPNLLVDKNWVVKVCDFGLSRMKHSTFLSSRSTAGTAEWMAPEVLRNEPSDEKCDVFSFGVILWELVTLQQPWEGMNAMQVVGAVGFQHRRLDIPKDMDPVIADMIARCWQTDPRMRPSFSEIMVSLKLLLKPITSNQVPRKTVSASASEQAHS